MNWYSTPREPVRPGETTPSPAAADLPPYPPTAGPLPRARRAAARHRKSSPSRSLVAGLALVSVLSAVAITMTVDPAAPAANGKPHPQSER
ncbi:hypothetical protein [Streptomyces sp. NPDC097981]|uniref:hypothetical protein n=1 Tax=Streptomyces sp. NPDC097981 TaxID=3155428 RepID=UPI003319873F